MRTADFDYHLPPEQIAQTPASPRDSSRLLILGRTSGALQHRHFHDLPDYLRAGDALVINETRVIPARLRCGKLPGGGAAELLLLKEIDSHTWETMAGGKGLRPGRRLVLAEGITATIEADLGGPRRRVVFSQPVAGWLDRIGETPLPPYIQTPLANQGAYQTVFARHPGSAAAPTAGLHFTPAMFERLETAGVKILRITLHIGLDTFAPVTEEDPVQHPIHTEWCSVDAVTAAALAEVKAADGRVLAVGTTAVRALETLGRSWDPSAPAGYEGPTDLFILPGFTFQLVDGMLTNFHLPRSTLIMLVSAFAGRERLLHAYSEAVRLGYRFYSFGDAMLIY